MAVARATARNKTHICGTLLCCAVLFLFVYVIVHVAAKMLARLA